MQITLAIDDDVLAAAENLAAKQHKTVDQIISELSRQALRPSMRRPIDLADLPVLPIRDNTPVTLEFVNKLRDGIDD